MDTLDLIHDDDHMTSMEDIPIDPVVQQQEEQPPPEEQPHPKEADPTKTSLLQSSNEEYNAKPNVKMLPMSKIRPTSEYFCFVLLHGHYGSLLQN